ncbi:hypothetical protein BGZ80_004466 [Entomortierella chlamydospora]|uniref:Zn(2)-C6 fungal-type domain-containing protein n=1 Tax=Entomortierella chlamydospora TaxID=101097 RepID=A0A9P6MMB0_9FUNG|nr:hypothetical protein BGZ79_010801 [Entomortierella chlamydospora]KAG0007602.1 hypothetical protein BGZ80_004466 [Entomortierella chlamydospora]
MSTPHQLSPIKQEPQVKQEPLSQPSVSLSYHAQPSIYQQQQPYANFSSTSTSSSTTGSLTSFQNLTSTANYNLPRHLMAMNMQHGAVSGASASTTNGTNSAAGSGAGTPVMASAHLSSNALSSAPPSPILNNSLQYHPNGANSQFGSNVNSNSNSGANSPYIQHQTYTQSPYQQQQQQHSYQHQNNGHPSDPSPSNYYSSSPPYGTHQQQQQQQQQQQGQHGSGNGSHVQFSSTAPSPMRQHQQSQYAPLVPPLSESQYAQYHQLLGSSAFSSTQSTPYHSNHTTPYSSMPGSPTREYQQLNEKQSAQKPKRRQVKNACVNCQKACKKCDEGRPCARCIKYGLTDTCVDSTRKVRKKGIKRGPYKRRPPPSQLGSASASTTPTMRNAVPGVVGYMSEPVTALNSPTQSHMLPFTSTAGAPLEFGYDTSGGPSGYSFHSQRVESSYTPPSYATSYSGSSVYAPSYSMS